MLSNMILIHEDECVNLHVQFRKKHHILHEILIHKESQFQGLYYS